MQLALVAGPGVQLFATNQKCLQLGSLPQDAGVLLQVPAKSYL
jgi:hypothetical protein